MLNYYVPKEDYVCPRVGSAG